MDDGSRNSSQGKGMVIDVSSFIEEDRAKLQQILSEYFSLDTSFHYRSNTNIKLYIKAKSAQRFCDLVKPYLLPSFHYKLTCS